jgi:hypothetical protein
MFFSDVKAHNTAVDLAERNMGADFGYPNLLSTEALKERAKAAKGLQFTQQ